MCICVCQKPVARCCLRARGLFLLIFLYNWTEFGKKTFMIACVHIILYNIILTPYTPMPFKLHSNTPIRLSLFILSLPSFPLCVFMCPMWQKEETQGKRRWMREGTAKWVRAKWESRQTKQNDTGWLQTVHSLALMIGLGKIRVGEELLWRVIHHNVTSGCNYNMIINYPCKYMYSLSHHIIDSSSLLFALQEIFRDAYSCILHHIKQQGINPL